MSAAGGDRTRLEPIDKQGCATHRFVLLVDGGATGDVTREGGRPALDRAGRRFTPIRG